MGASSGGPRWSFHVAKGWDIISEVSRRAPEERKAGRSCSSSKGGKISTPLWARDTIEGVGECGPIRFPRETEGAMSDFGLSATDAREPRQVRKEATVASLSVCSGSTRSLPKPFSIADFRFTAFDMLSQDWGK